MIPQETIEQVAAANDIVEIINSYVPLKRAGSVYKALCPFHREKTPSFNVNPVRQTFKCFGCGAGGTVFKFITLFENIEFPAAVRRLAERAGIPIVEEDFGRTGEERGAGELRRRLLALHADAAAWFHRNLMRSPGAQHARDYLRSRGLTGEVAGRWQLGYAPESWDACLQWSSDEGYRTDELVQSGLVTSREPDEEGSGAATRIYDRFRDRLMFPICNEAGEVIAFSGRVLSADASPAKYVNSPETPLFTKGKVLFGLHMAKRALLEAKMAIVCEGQIDLITAFEAGVKNVTAPQGTAFTEQQARLLKRHVEEVVLCFDADAAGQQAAERSLPALLEANLAVRVATMAAGEDPDSLIRKQGAAAFTDRIAAAKDFFDFQIDRLGVTFDLNTPRGKLQFSRRIAESVALLSDPMLREAVVGKVSARVGMAAESFRALLKRRPATAARREADFRAYEAASDPMPDGAAEFERPPKVISDLLKLTLENSDARAWLLDQNWRDLLPRISASDLLSRSLSADLNIGDAAGINAFLATLSSEEESFVSGLGMERPFAHPLTVARDCWRGLERHLLRERQIILESQMRLPDMPPEEANHLMKEYLDLQVRLKDIARL